MTWDFSWYFCPCDVFVFTTRNEKYKSGVLSMTPCLSKRCLPLATVGKGHDKHFPYSTELQADLGPNNCSLSYIPIFMWARSAFGLPVYSCCPAEGRKHAWNERLFLLVIKFITKLSFLILQLYLHVLPCIFFKSTSSHVHPICKHEYLQMKGNLTEAGEGKGSISALHRSKHA